ncbi:hypothetical protein EKO27_g4631 [Xylaria grammica]|uniref:Uncharacterized protein n=1 Tax=Xylaria grammica TaxID=363999 RepID=A0A439D7U2_9PEZI|nr:hypothetical protein EKO27_g4631 [Xylaria grammica]
MSHTFEQFVRFTTDAAGLERTLRLLQSIVQILSSYTLPFECLLFLLASLPLSTSKAGPDVATTHAVLVGLRGQLAFARRYFRLFRFLESFHAAQKLYLSLSHANPAARPRWGNTDIWIDVFGRTFNGMYLLLEASTIADAQKIPGLTLWGPELEAAVTVEGQRFCDVNEKEEGSVTEDEKAGDEGGGKEGADQLARNREIRSKISGLGRRVVSDTLDITLPGSVVGWVPVSTGTVGLAMFVTTVLTSMDIWERCGREVASSMK